MRTADKVLEETPELKR